MIQITRKYLSYHKSKGIQRLKQKGLLNMNLKILIILSIFCSKWTHGAELLFKVGLVADCQYAEKTSFKRKYSMSLIKLNEAVDHLNQERVDMSFHLGDFIDEKFANFEKVISITKRLNHPLYHVLGNHDFSVEDHFKEMVPSTLK